MKLSIFLIIFSVLFFGCEEKVEPKKKKKPIDFMIEKSKVLVDNNKSLSQTFENEGMVIDGGKDKRLLEIAKSLKDKSVIIGATSIMAFEKLMSEADFADASIINELFEVINSFSYARGADGTEFYFRKGSRVIELPKNKLENGKYNKKSKFL